MKMFKRLAGVLLIMVLTLSLTACTVKSNDNTSENSKQDEQSENNDTNKSDSKVQIPESYFDYDIADKSFYESLSTEEVLRAFLEYRYAVDFVYAYNTVEIAVEAMKRRSYAFCELIKRDDAKEVFEYYAYNMDELMKKIKSPQWEKEAVPDIMRQLSNVFHTGEAGIEDYITRMQEEEYKNSSSNEEQ